MIHKKIYIKCKKNLNIKTVAPCESHNRFLQNVRDLYTGLFLTFHDIFLFLEL